MASSAAVAKRYNVYSTQVLTLSLIIIIGVRLAENVVHNRHLDGQDNRGANLTGKQQEQSEVQDDCKQGHSSHQGPINPATRQQHQTGAERLKREHGRHRPSGQLESFSMDATGLGDLEEPDAIRIMVRRRKRQSSVNTRHASKTEPLDQVDNSEWANFIRTLTGRSMLRQFEKDKRIGGTNKTIFHSSRTPKIPMESNRLPNNYNDLARLQANLARTSLDRFNIPEYRQFYGHGRPGAMSEVFKLLSGQQPQEQARTQALARLRDQIVSSGANRRIKKYSFDTNPILIDRRTVVPTIGNQEPVMLSTNTPTGSEGHQQEILDDNNDGEYDSRFSLLTTRKIQPDELIIAESSIDLVNDDGDGQGSNDQASLQLAGDGYQQTDGAVSLDSELNRKQGEESLEQLLNDPILISASSNYLPRIARASLM